MYEKMTRREFEQKIKDLENRVCMLKKAEKLLNKSNEWLEEKVRRQTVELDEKTTALKVLFEQRGVEKKQLEETIISNVKELITPSLRRLKNSKLSSRQQKELNLLEKNLNEIVLPFTNNAHPSYLKLTPTEIQVANFIKHGAPSKDIADSLGLSQRTVDTHRYHIRKKIGISGKGLNLRECLCSHI